RQRAEGTIRLGHPGTMPEPRRHDKPRRRLVEFLSLAGTASCMRGSCRDLRGCGSERFGGALRDDGLIEPAAEGLGVGAGIDLLLLLGAEWELPEREHTAQDPALLRPAALLPAFLPALLQALPLAFLPALLPAPVLAELDQVLDHHRLQVCLFHGLDHR